MASLREVHGVNRTTYEVGWHEGKSQPSRTFKTKGEAREFKREIERRKRSEKAQGIHSTDRVKYGEWSERWFAEAVSELTPKVRAQYRRYSDKNIVPYWSNVVLRDILPDKLPAWIKWMQERQVAVSSINESMVVFRSSLSYAVEMQMLSQNPAAGRKRYMPRYAPSKERPELTPMHVAALARAAGEDQLLVMVMAVLALRPGEAIGLQAGDVRKSYLSVERSVVKAPGIGMVEGRTKNRKSRRVRTMFLADSLHSLAEGKAKDDLLFPGPHGYLNTDTVLKRVRRAGERIGIDALTADDLRHVAITNALELSNSVKFMTELAGHESGPAIALEHYAKLTKGAEAEAIKHVTEAYRDWYKPERKRKGFIEVRTDTGRRGFTLAPD